MIGKASQQKRFKNISVNSFPIIWRTNKCVCTAKREKNQHTLDSFVNGGTLYPER
jgi:hypothetical protein